MKSIPRKVIRQITYRHLRDIGFTPTEARRWRDRSLKAINEEIGRRGIPQIQIPRFTKIVRREYHQAKTYTYYVTTNVKVGIDRSTTEIKIDIPLKSIESAIDMLLKADPKIERFTIKVEFNDVHGQPREVYTRTWHKNSIGALLNDLVQLITNYLDDINQITAIQINAAGNL